MASARDDDQASALERALQGPKDEATGEIASLVALARMIEALPQPDIDLSFADRLEARLMAEASAPSQAAAAAAATPAAATSAGPAAPSMGRAPAQVYRPAGPLAQPAGNVVMLQSRLRKIRRSLGVAIAAAMMLALPVAASANAAPGSPMYGARLAREEARLWAQCRSGHVSCGFAHMDRAGYRLRDLRLVVARDDTDQIQPTTERLHSDLTAGTRKVIAGKPPVATLERLQRRLDKAHDTLVRLVSAAPAEARDSIAATIAARDLLAKDVVVAIRVADGLPVAPPVAIGPKTPGHPQPEPKPADQNQNTSGSSDSPGRTPRRKPTDPNEFGPGGTPRIDNKPRKTGETWGSDDPVRDPCLVGMVAAPGMEAVCAATKDEDA